jgi:hypothetical protein
MPDVDPGIPEEEAAEGRSGGSNRSGVDLGIPEEEDAEGPSGKPPPVGRKSSPG